MVFLKGIVFGALMTGAAILPSVALAAEGDETTSGAWRITQTKSAVDDSLEISALNVVADIPTQLLSNKPGGVFIRCKDQKTELAVVTAGFLGLPFGDNGVKVVYRVDTNPATTEQWHLSTDGKAAFYPRSPISFVRALPAYGQLLIRLYDFQGAYEESVFALDGLDPVRDAVATACHWPPPKT